MKFKVYKGEEPTEFTKSVLAIWFVGGRALLKVDDSPWIEWVKGQSIKQSLGMQ